MLPQLLVRTMKQRSNSPEIVGGRSTWVAERSDRIGKVLKENISISYLPVIRTLSVCKPEQMPLIIIFTYWTIHLVKWDGERFYSSPKNQCVLSLWVTDCLIKLVFTYLFLTLNMFNPGIVYYQQFADRGMWVSVCVFICAHKHTHKYIYTYTHT